MSARPFPVGRKPCFGWDMSTDGRGVLLSHPGDGPILTIGATGTGKSRRVAIPNLKRFAWSTILCDFQDGQLTRASAFWRSHALGQEFIIVDPAQVVDPKWLPKNVKYGQVDPVDYIRRSRLPLSEAMTVAQAFIPFGTLRDSHWAKGAQAALAARFMFVAFDPVFEELGLPRNMRSVWRLLSDPELERASLKFMTLSENSFIVDQANAFLKAGKDNNEMRGIRNQIRVSCADLFSEPAILDCLSDTNIDFTQLRTKPTTVSIVLPGKFAKSQAAFVRAILTIALGDIEASGLRAYDPTAPPIVVQVDEAPVLGNFSLLIDALARMRAYGVMPHLFAQNLGQLKENFGEAGLSSLMGNIEIVQYFGGTNDVFTAETLSKLCGTDTHVEMDTGQSSRPGDGGSTHYKTYGRPNMMPDEIMRLPLPEQLLIRIGKSPAKGMVFDTNLAIPFPDYAAFQGVIERGGSVESALRVAELMLRPAPASVAPRKQQKSMVRRLLAKVTARLGGSQWIRQRASDWRQRWPALKTLMSAYGWIRNTHTR